MPQWWGRPTIKAEAKGSIEMDHNKAAMLLHVLDKAKNWPNLKGIHDAAMHELGLLNGEALEEAAERAEAAKKARAEADAKIVAQTKSDADRAQRQADTEAASAKTAATRAQAQLDRRVEPNPIVEADLRSPGVKGQDGIIERRLSPNAEAEQV